MTCENKGNQNATKTRQKFASKLRGKKVLYKCINIVERLSCKLKLQNIKTRINCRQLFVQSNLIQYELIVLTIYIP